MSAPAAKDMLSVVIAHHGNTAALQHCLHAHAAELEEGDELLAVIAGTPDECRRLQDACARAVVIEAPPDALIPRLWSLGMQRARGEVVRVSIGSFLPVPGWRSVLRSAFRGSVDVLGGPMSPAEGLRWRDAAVFLQRYRMYQPPFERREVADVPADHCAYRRAALTSTAALWAEEFWERDVNAVLARDGARLILDPAFGATYTGGESAQRFVAHRFLHAIQFGRARVAERGNAVRAMYVLAFVLPGGVFLAKIVRESLAVPGNLRRLLMASGWLGLFVASWACGEWVGAILGPARRSRSAAN